MVRSLRGSVRKQHDNISYTLMSLPMIVFFVLFNYAPLFGLVLAFKNFNVRDGIFGSPWIGLKNFEFFLKSQYASRITMNTLYLNFLFIVIGTAAALALALILKELHSRWFSRFSQSVLLFPSFISWVIVGYFSYALFNMDGGVLNTILKGVGRDPVLWYNWPEVWPLILLVAYLWKNTGYTCIIYLAGLSSINQEYYEAAEMDGCGKVRQMFYISLPLLIPLISLMTLMSIGRIMYADFGMFYNLTRDAGPLLQTTDVMDTFIYRSLRVTGDIGMSSAANFYQAVMGFILVAVSNYIVRKVSPESALY